MEIDPATVCARTSAGEAELDRAQNGLTLPQRKALSLLAAPRVYAEFAAENHLDSERLARDFTRLAELGLISLQLGSVVIVPPARARASSPPPRHAPAARRAAKSAPPAPAQARPDPQLRPVVLGAAAGRSPLRLAAFAGVAAVALTAGWLALRGGPITPRVDAAAGPAPVPIPILSPAPVVATAPAPQESTATPTTSAAPPALAASIAASAPTRPVATDKQARDASARESRPATKAIAEPAPELTRVAAASPAAPPTAPPPAVPTIVSERTAESAAPLPTAAAPPAPAPVLVASAARTPVGAAPSVKAALQPIVREAPEFPKEAMSEGISSGTVTARVTVDAAGKVTGIEILDARPRRVFDRAVRAALWRWQFEAGAPDRTAEVEIAFARQ